MSIMKQFLDTSHLFGGNAPFIEELYENYLDAPDSVPTEWRDFFDKIQLLPVSGSNQAGRDVPHAPVVEAFALRARSGAPRATPAVASLERKQVSVVQLIAEYRFRGGLLADLDPLKQIGRAHV